ncbi:MAG: serine dehydratase subunit alpha family protein, partial [Clostridia bacterium]|nr:serine dehydratase subunit alpha family protein [Clostridia bacterium]
YLGIDEDKMFRAVTLSHLIAIYIHSNTAILSALCGGTIAGTGASCGLAYLLGGGPQQLSYAVNNMLGCVAGMLCDGAKPDCSMKISACVNVAFLSAYMAMDNIGVSAIEGIVSEDPAHTVKNFARVSNEGSPVLDNIILDIMLNK